MWLTYGLDANENLVEIREVASGKTHLRCPYCDGQLTAKKGKVKQHHFAHTLETCRFVANRGKEPPELPLYENFNFLSSKEFERLKELWSQYGCKKAPIPTSLVLPSFIYRGLLTANPDASYQFTALGKIPVGALSLKLFNQVQEPLIFKKLSELEGKAERAQLAGLSTLREYLADLRIYRAQITKILTTTLYYLEVLADGNMLYKIGITQRPINERISEIQRDLKQHFQEVAINVLGTWERRGNVEKYFKYRYQTWNYPVGALTEYYKFRSEDAARSLHDLKRMQPKVLTEVEARIL